MERVAIGNSRDLMAALGRSAQAGGRDYLVTARAVLRRLVADPDLVDAARLDRRPGALSRNLLFGAGGISVWAMVWSPGAATPVHDHHCSCCFGILGGALRETWFRAVSPTHAVTTAEVIRRPGFVACMLPSGPNLHRIVNDGPEEAISIHVYGYDHEAHASSVDRTYEILPG
ncbi:cysteine dioxygenase family protein [uncultured Methylobacterium sp.]|uniref:cysteine dioxygenase family protein n=1 Tax=uncultured Methylobacterium sp. TaxID=157278 RepID=UPI0026107B92|nr:cysteine dioxygenase family protein [uncultured Methylobacterium sp.]